MRAILDPLSPSRERDAIPFPLSWGTVALPSATGPRERGRVRGLFVVQCEFANDPG